MTIENYFLKLDRDLLCNIFVKSGNISEISKVCRVFNEIMNAKAEFLYKILAKEFGENSVQQALKALQLEKKSYPTKINGLFYAALRSAGIETPLKGIDYDADALKQYMEPLVCADHLGKLWGALFKNAHSQLKDLMKQLRFGQTSVDNAELVRQFLNDNALEIQKISALNLSRQNLKFLPSEIAFFSRLHSLDISHNSLTELPDEIGCLQELIELRISNNLLKSLPKAIGDLKRLKNFQCSSNQLSTFPDEICEMKELKTLNLSRNRIDCLPEGIDKLQSLNYLFLESNQLSSLPSNLGAIPYLVGLYLFDNQISALPDSLSKLGYLKYLSIQNNALKCLPENIGGISSLQSLIIDGNTLSELPQSICNLTALKFLSISRNELLTLPEGMERLKKLAFFDYANNSFSKFPEGVQTLPFWSLNPDFSPRLNNGIEQLSLNAALSDLQFTSTYWHLGSKKWKEGIDGKHHVHGPEVYDLNLHGKYAEPGFLNGIKCAFQFLGSRPNRKIDAEFYLALHKAACGHFKGKETNTLMGQEKVGVFRGSGDAITATFSEPDYFMTQNASNEFNDLNGELTLHFGSSFRIGDLILKSNVPKIVTIYYQPLSKEQIAIIFNYFLTEFYYDIGHSQGDESKIKAIAKFIQRLEWLHPVRDGCGRTDTALLNYLLTCYGFNPVILANPYVSSCNGLNELVPLIRSGIQEWQKEDPER
jgi:Leucine-rich repeat (LRR) protein